MKKLYLYIMCGLSFSGKTTLAKELVKHLGVKRVSIDEINNERGIWDDETGLSAQEWDNTYQEAYRRIDAFLSQRESVVDDSVNFTREQRDRLRAIAKKHGAFPLVIFVDTPLAEARRRQQENRQTRLRGDVRDDDFDYVVQHFEPPTADENVLCFSGRISPEEWIHLRLLEKEIEGDA